MTDIAERPTHPSTWVAMTWDEKEWYEYASRLDTWAEQQAAALAAAEAEIARLREALTGLVEAVVAEVNDPQKGGSGYLLARLSDARAALAEPVALIRTQVPATPGKE